jgi:hypothetical protein
MYNCSTNSRELAHRGVVAMNAPSPMPLTRSHEPCGAPYTASIPRAGISERAPPSHLGQLSPIEYYAGPYLAVTRLDRVLDLVTEHEVGRCRLNLRIPR